MIVRFFKTGLSRGEAPVKYVLGETDHDGDARFCRPQILEGNPEQTIRLINQCTRRHKYSSGVLAFRGEEAVCPNQLTAILDKFRETIAPGISPEQYQCLFVLHKDPIDKKTGNQPFHVHFVIPMTFLAGETHNGKSLAGKRFNPHPPGKTSQEIMALFAATVNHEHGWKQIVEDPLRLGIDSFWRKIEGQTNQRKVDLLGKELTQRVKNGALTNRDELIGFIENDLGCAITRKSENYISVRLPHMTKSIRLKGKLFEAKTDYAREFATHSLQNSRTMSTLTVPEYEQAKTRLNQLLEERKPVLLGYRPKPSITTKEKNDGYKQTNGIRGKQREETRVISNRNERKIHTSPRQRPQAKHEQQRHLENPVRNSTDSQPTLSATNAAPRRQRVGQRVGSKAAQSDQPRTSAGTNPISNPRTSGGISAQDTSRSDRPSSSNASASQSRNLSALLNKSAGTLEEINDQLRQLGMALSHTSYEGQTAIQYQINALVGRRERLPGPK